MPHGGGVVAVRPLTAEQSGVPSHVVQSVTFVVWGESLWFGVAKLFAAVSGHGVGFHEHCRGRAVVAGNGDFVVCGEMRGEVPSLHVFGNVVRWIPRSVASSRCFF